MLVLDIFFSRKEGNRMFDFTFNVEHLFSFTVQLTPPEVIGPLAEGLRSNYHFVGGEIHGPQLHGKIRPGGGDWATLRTDGVGVLDIRGTIETDDGALIYSAYTGLIETGEDGYERFLRQDLPPVLPLRTAPRYSTVHPNYLWLNRLQCIGIGEIDFQQMEVRFDIYALI
jgi:Protein of unknown function (DUF3237)